MQCYANFDKDEQSSVQRNNTGTAKESSRGGINVKIQRKRYIVMRKDRTEVWCGLSKNFSFRPVSEVKDVSIKTYRSEAQARAGCSSWDRDFEIVPVTETIETEE